MKKAWLVLVAAMWVGLGAAFAGDNAHRIGAGANYWVALEDVEADVDEEGFSYLISYQFRPGLLGLQLDGEMLPDRFGEDAYAPAAYVLVGKAIYAAAGIGIVNQDGDWADAPFFAFKAGLDLEVLPRLFLDVSASYRFDAETELEDAIDAIDTDTIFLGAAARFAF